MLSSFCTNVVKLDEIPDAVSTLASLGYDGVEFWDSCIRFYGPDRLKALLDSNRIRCSQICPYFDFTGDEDKWRESIRIAQEYVDLSLKLGRPLIRVFTGRVGARDASETQWKRAVSALREICKMGARSGVKFALETHGGSLMETTDSTLKLLDDVGADNLGVNLQVPLGREDVYETARRLGKYVIHVHAHNWEISLEGEPFSESDLTFLEVGTINFRKFVGILVERGFRGYVSIEHATHGGKHAWRETAEREIKYLKRLAREFM